MIRLLKNRYALSTVVTTLIILVVSILLASVLTFFATNVVGTRVQEESLYVSRQHIWVNSAGVSEGAVMVTNNGGRDVVINKIAVRGQAIAWTSVFYANADPDVDTLTADLTYVTAPVAATNDLGITDTAHATTTDLVLPSGNTMIIFFNRPDSIGLTDVGLTVSIAVDSAQAVYYSETNIQAAPA